MISLTVILEMTKVTIEVPAEAACWEEAAEFHSHLRKDLEGMRFDRDEAHGR